MWRYTLIENEKVTQEMAKLGNYTSPACMRSNGTQTIVKWKGKKPRYLYGKTEIDIKIELSKPEWQLDDVK